MLLIKKWDETFENADTRKRQRLGWYMNPSGCDSAGYIELMSHGTDGVLAFAVFQAICQWSATNRQQIRGKMARTDGTGMNLRQISAVIRMPVDVVQRAFVLLTSKDVGWIVETDIENPANFEICHQSASNLPKPASDLPLLAGDLPALCKEKEKEKEKEKDKEKEKVVACPANFIASEFAAAVGGNVIVTDKRRKHLAARWRNDFWREHWQEALERSCSMPFLQGENDRGWKMDFDWFIQPDSVVKIMEGKYSSNGNRTTLTAAQHRENANASAFNTIRAAIAASSD